MKIASYNILSGGFRDYNYQDKQPERFEIIKQAIKEINADLIGLIDTFRWDELYTNEQVAEMLGYKKAYCINLNDERLKKKGHNNGISVVSNLAEVKFSTINLITRDAIKVETRELNVYFVYLDDMSEDTRIKQIKALLEYANPNLPSVIMGDLNTLSDGNWEGMSPWLNKIPSTMAQEIIPKLKDMAREEVVKIIKETGFEDADKSKEPTTPTKLFPIQLPRAIMRIDYAFVSKQIKVSNFQVYKGEIFNKASDHFPIGIDIEL